ncbi:MAG: acetoacetate decarboxylase family protein [Solirubrobacteraceae bacterium]
MNDEVQPPITGEGSPGGPSGPNGADAPGPQSEVRGTPLDSPLYEFDPLRGVEYWGCRTLVALFTVTGDLAGLLPEGLQAVGENPLGMVLIAEYGGSTLGRYSELTSLVQVRTEDGMLAMYVPYIYVTNDAALAAGREVIGAPKKLAAIEIANECDVVQGTLERPAGKRLATLTVKPSRRLDPAVLGTAIPPGTPCLSLRHLPAPPGGTFVHELVQWSSELFLHSDANGEQCAFTGPGSLTYDSPSAIDPVHRLGVGTLIATAYMEFDMRLTAGRVVRSYGRPAPDALVSTAN